MDRKQRGKEAFDLLIHLVQGQLSGGSSEFLQYR